MVGTVYNTPYNSISKSHKCKHICKPKGGIDLPRHKGCGRRVEIPAWARPIRHDMVDANITITALAREIGFSRAYISDVMNGTRISPEAQEKIIRWHEQNFRQSNSNTKEAI